MRILIGAGIVCGIIMLTYYSKSGHTIKNAFKGMITGGLLLVLVSYFGYKINIALPLSFFNTIVSLVLGVPGVILLVVGKILLV